MNPTMFHKQLFEVSVRMSSGLNEVEGGRTSPWERSYLTKIGSLEIPITFSMVPFAALSCNFRGELLMYISTALSRIA